MSGIRQNTIEMNIVQKSLFWNTESWEQMRAKQLTLTRKYCEELLKYNTIDLTIWLHWTRTSDIKERAGRCLLKTWKLPGDRNILRKMVVSFGDAGTDDLPKIGHLLSKVIMSIPFHKKQTKKICKNFHSIALGSHVNEVMLRIVVKDLKYCILSHLIKQNIFWTLDFRKRHWAYQHSYVTLG